MLYVVVTRWMGFDFLHGGSITPFPSLSSSLIRPISLQFVFSLAKPLLHECLRQWGWLRRRTPGNAGKKRKILLCVTPIPHSIYPYIYNCGNPFGVLIGYWKSKCRSVERKSVFIPYGNSRTFGMTSPVCGTLWVSLMVCERSNRCDTAVSSVSVFCFDCFFSSGVSSSSHSNQGRYNFGNDGVYC